MEKVCQSTFKKSGRMRERGMDRSRMRKAWLQVMRSCGFPKASEKSGGGGGSEGYDCNRYHQVRKIQVDQMA